MGECAAACMLPLVPLVLLVLLVTKALVLLLPLSPLGVSAKAVLAPEAPPDTLYVTYGAQGSLVCLACETHVPHGKAAAPCGDGQARKRRCSTRRAAVLEAPLPAGRRAEAALPVPSTYMDLTDKSGCNEDEPCNGLDAIEAKPRYSECLKKCHQQSRPDNFRLERSRVLQSHQSADLLRAHQSANATFTRHTLNEICHATTA